MSPGDAHLAPDFSLRVNGSTSRDADVTRIEVVQQPNTLDHAQLTFAHYPLDVGERSRPDLFKLFREGSEVELSLGYVDQLTKIFAGEVTGIVANFPEDGAATIEIHCHSFLHRLLGARLTKTYLKVKDSAIAAQIAQTAGLRARADDTKTQHAYVLQYNQTNLEFLLARASRIGYELLADDKTLIFRKAGDAARPTIKLDYGAAAADALVSVSLREELLGQGNAVSVRGVDPLKGELIVGKARSSALTPAAGGRQLGPAVAVRAFGAAESVVVDRPVATLAEADALALSVLNRRARSFLTGTGRCIGAPALRAGGVVDLGGLGDKFNGSYYVVQSTHTFGDEGYLTSFRVRRNAVG